MSYAVMPMTDYVGACNAVREKTGNTEVIRSGELAEQIDEVYHAGQLNVLTNAECLKGYAEGETVTITDISSVEHNVGVKLSSKNLFDKDNADIIVGMFSSGTSVSPASTTRSVYIPCVPDTVYTVSKMVSARFAIGFTSEEPAADVEVVNVKTGNTALTLTSTSAADSKYLVVWCYHASYDTEVTLEEIIDTLQIEIGETATEYTPFIADVSGIKVSVCGKNLLNLDGREEFKFGDWGNTNKRVFPGGKGILFNLAWNNYYSGTNFDTASENWSVGDGKMSFLMLQNGYGIGIDLALKPNTQYTFSRATANEVVYLMEYDADGNYLTATGLTSGKTITTQATTAWGVLQLGAAAKTEAYITLPQLEYGTTATEYEPGIEATEYTASADGTVEGIKSIYPSMSISSDTEGVIINANYYRDIDKAFAELTTAIAMSGGE